MYDEDVKMSKRHTNALKAFVEASIDTYDKKTNVPEKKQSSYNEDAINSITNRMMVSDAMNRYHSFSETLRNTLVVESLYKLFVESADMFAVQEASNRSIMRAIVNEYVTETGYTNIMNRMKNASVFMSNLHSTITESVKAILEEVDKEDPNTFAISPEMKDEFFKQLDYSDSEEISNAIKDRVSDAMKDFVTANAKDHEDINTALQQAQEKIEDIDPKDTELREYYEMKAKRAVTEIRNSPKNVLHSMVTSMCESVIKHKDAHSEFYSEGHLDMDKIVTRTSLMYTFIEMLNTTRLDNINESFIEKILVDLKK